MKLDFVKTTMEVYSVILRDVSAYGGFPFYGIVFVCALLANEFIFAQNIALSLIAVTIIVGAIRLSYYKPRPGQPKQKFKTYYERIDGSSFPSIHAARAVMITMALYSKLQMFLPVLLLLTVIVLLSRVHFKRHDAKDLAIGVLIGLILGYYFF